MFERQINGVALAEQLKCGAATIYRYLNATKMPSVEMTVKLADYFNVSCDYLIGAENESYAKTFKVCPPFSEQFKKLLKDCGVSQYELEKRTGISHSVVGYWKNGKTCPSIESVEKIAKALGCTVDFVLGRSN